MCVYRNESVVALAALDSHAAFVSPFVPPQLLAMSLLRFEDSIVARQRQQPATRLSRIAAPIAGTKKQQLHQAIARTHGSQWPFAGAGAAFLGRVFSSGKRAMIGALVASWGVQHLITCFTMEEFES